MHNIAKLLKFCRLSPHSFQHILSHGTPYLTTSKNLNQLVLQITDMLKQFLKQFLHKQNYTTSIQHAHILFLL